MGERTGAASPTRPPPPPSAPRGTGRAHTRPDPAEGTDGPSPCHLRALRGADLRRGLYRTCYRKLLGRLPPSRQSAGTTSRRPGGVGPQSPAETSPHPRGACGGGVSAQTNKPHRKAGPGPCLRRSRCSPGLPGGRGRATPGRCGGRPSPTGATARASASSTPRARPAGQLAERGLHAARPPRTAPLAAQRQWTNWRHRRPSRRPPPQAILSRVGVPRAQRSGDGGARREPVPAFPTTGSRHPRPSAKARA